jgi:predicted DNA binding CopG/RHH family protein
MKEMLEKLQQAYSKENEALQKLVEFQGGYFFDADRKALLNKDFRIKLAEHIREVGRCYMEAAEVLKN